MSESGGKLALLKQQARQAVATAPGRAIGEAARQEIEPVMSRLDEMTAALALLPERFQEAAHTSADSLRESLSPMVAQVASLRTSLEMLPTLLAQQTDGVVAQIQAEGQSMRSQIQILRGGLVTLPDALANQMAPVLAMAERLDDVLTLQRSSLAALHDQTMAAYRGALDPTTQRIETALGALSKQSKQTGSTLQGMKGLSKEIRDASQEAKEQGEATAYALKTAVAGQWHPLVQVVVTAALAAGLIVGGLVWLGTHGSNGLLRPAAPSAKEQAWDSLYQRAPAQWQQSMDQFLAASGGK